MVRRTAGALVLALGLTACSGISSAPVDPQKTSATGRAGSGTASASASRTAPGSSASAESSGSSESPAGGGTESQGADTITLAFAGDVHFERHLRSLLTRPEALAPLKASLGAADFSMLNLETAITEGGDRVTKNYTFRAPATALKVLAAAGVDAVSMANNHAADFGRSGLADTLAAKKSSPIPMVGIGADAAEAFEPVIVDVKGVKVALLASLQLYEETSARFSAGDTKAGVATNLDMTRLRAATRAAAAKADVVVVMMHWGTEYTTCADDWQKRTLAALKDDGADLVVGGHAHRIQGAGWDGRTFVGWGLGNFMWWKPNEPDARTGVLTVTIDAAAAKARGQAQGEARRTSSPLAIKADWTPMLVGRDGVPRPPKTTATTSRLAKVWSTATTCSGVSPTAS